MVFKVSNIVVLLVFNRKQHYEIR